MSKKVSALTKPVIETLDSGAHGANVTGFVVMKSTAEVEVRVIAAIKPLENIGYEVALAVQYEVGGIWYWKQADNCFNLRDALKRAYGLSRKYYAVAASRAFAGLLHDSVVPATEDIDC